jgi:hypothetical protein
VLSGAPCVLFIAKWRLVLNYNAPPVILQQTVSLVGMIKNHLGSPRSLIVRARRLRLSRAGDCGIFISLPGVSAHTAAASREMLVF